MTARLVRVASADGIQHANRPAANWTLCGKRATPERYGWPATSRCAECVAEAERLLHVWRDREETHAATH